MNASDFDKWNDVKKQTNINKRNLGVKPREIFWAKIGVNVGDEEYGKGDMFSRPILIIRQLTSDLVLAVPLTTTIKDNDYFHSFQFNTKKGISSNSAMILQIKTFSKKRITSKIGKLNIDDFKKIQDKIVKMIVPT